MAPKLILAGFMATGKSVVGPLLARRLGWRFIDSDAEVVIREGRPIAEIFAHDGEVTFRAVEREVIADLSSDPRRCAMCGRRRPAVIATGGGVLADEGNFAALHRAGVIVCLTARAEVIANRIGESARARPKLTEGGLPVAQRVRQLMAERAAAYARADATIDTSDLSIEQVVERVLDAYAAAARSR